MEVVTDTHVRQVLEEIASYRGIVYRDLERFTAKHAEPLATFGLNVGELRRDAQARERAVLSPSRFMSDNALRKAANAWGDAGEAVFTAARGVLSECREAAQQHFEPAYRGERMAKVAEAARPRFRTLLEDWDRATEDLVATCAASAYPKLLAGADELLLRSEAEMLLGKAKSGYHGLIALVASERRDLAAVALSPWASSWASVNGLTDRDLAAVRSAAIEAAKTLGTPSEQAAANIYRDLYSLFGLRAAFQGALRAATSLFADERELGFPAGYKAGSVDLLAWRDGPYDFPPLTKLAV